ncbi:myo-inositol 2-dehydrogenase [Pseudohyphozyma bogoriensis]|nr:myo-inositol 2-dehydrogenase [Pseudohyphozyma bogoriensis]
MSANIAILGCGRQGRVHANAIQAIGAPARLHSVFDVFSAAAEALSAEHPHHPKVHKTVESVFADPEVQGVIIVTPSDTHAPLLLQAVQAGKAVLCEKPLDKDLDRLIKLKEELMELEKTRQLPYMAVGFPKRHDPSFLALKAQIDSGAYGPLEHLIIHARDTEPSPVSYMKTSGGQITDTCVHDFDLARLIMGPDDTPASVFVHGSTKWRPDICAEANDTTRVTITLKTIKGTLLSILSARHCSAGNDQRVEAHCALGDLLADNPVQNDLTLAVSSAAGTNTRLPYKTLTAERYEKSFVVQMQEFTAALFGGGGPLPPGVQKGSSIDDGIWAQRAVAAAQRSLETGQAVYF